MPIESRTAYIELLRKLLEDDSDRGDLASQLWTLSMQRIGSGDWIYHPSWLIWGCLADWLDNKPDERKEAEAMMIQAAKEFLALDGERVSEENYFDRWVYDQCGYKRTSMV